MADIKLMRFQRKIGIGKEAGYGTLGTTNRYIPIEDPKLDYSRNVVSVAQVGIKNTETSAFLNDGKLEVNFKMPVDANSIGELLLSIFGTVTTTEATKGASGTQYKHTFTLAETIKETLPSIFLKDDWGQNNVYDYSGIRGNKITFSVASKEVLNLDYSGIGKNEIAGTSDSSLAYASSVSRPFLFSQLTMQIDGTNANGIYNVECSVNQNLSDGYRLGTDYNTKKPLPQKSEIEIKFLTEYESFERARYTGGSYVGIVLDFVGNTIVGTAKEELKILLPKVVYTTAPFDYGADSIKNIAITGKALEDGTSFAGTSFPIKIELYNTIANY